MKATLDTNDRQFLERLHRLSPASVQEVCDDLGVTATAVRQRLVRLFERGLVRRESVTAGRGRPHHVYELTEAGLRELGDNYSELASILWREMQAIEEVGIRRKVFERVREALVLRYGGTASASPLPERLDGLRSSLAEHGFDVEVDTSGPLPILRENSCPYLDLAESDAAICDLEQAVFEKVLGTRLTLTQCCLDGHHCCEVQPAVHE
ncbi:MAG: helix-turn-helix transcriptional regulator [Planctomycetes bacterium]|nr:helix-turn-helix transcriptional regulator [Planctomycetota bacterium]